MFAMALRELRFNSSQHTASIVVSFLGALLGALLIEAETILQQQSAAGGFYVHPYVPLVLGVLGFVFVMIATFVAVIVTANTFAIVMAGRAQRTALFRLLGTSARTLRGAVTIEGAVVGAIGAVLGLAAGVVAASAVSGALMASTVFQPMPMDFFPWPLVFPVLVGAGSTTAAAWLGTRGVVKVSPIEALGSIQEPTFEAVQSTVRSRRVGIAAMTIGGFALLIAGVAIGSVSPWGLMPAVVGGALSFLGFVGGSSAFLPPVLNFVGRRMGVSAATKLAAANAMRYPARTARSTVALVIGLTLVTMFGVAGQTYSDVAGRIAATLPQSARDGVSPFLNLVLGVIGILVGFSLLIAAVGLVNSLSLGVIQRRREIGLLRALGFSRGQVRRMIFAESIQLTITGTVCGLVLGTIYGWAGALTALASDHHVGGYFWVSFPLWLFVAIVGSAALLAVVASLIPSMRATRISPVQAAALD